MTEIRHPHAWEKSYPPGIRWDSPIVTSTLQELLDRAVAEYGERPVLLYRDRRLSYRELGNQAARAAAAFRHIGIGRGCAVARYLPNTAWHPIAFFGVLRTGSHVVHLSPLDAEREPIHQLTESGVRTLVTVNLFGLREKALRLAAAGHLDRVIVADDGVWDSLSPSSVAGSAIGQGRPSRDAGCARNPRRAAAHRRRQAVEEGTDRGGARTQRGFKAPCGIHACQS
jgi:acyl-CoA synthetase (AMP-forming)/AMP-acid ligase II